MDGPEANFGCYIKIRREALGKSLRGFASDVGISPAYMSDIEKGFRPAPKKYVDRMADVLNIVDPSELHRFYDLAGVSMNGQHKDINSYIGDKPHARVAMRVAIDHGFTDKDWERIIEMIKSGMIK